LNNRVPIALELDGQVLSYADDLISQSTVHAQQLVFEGWVVGLAGADEAEAGVARLKDVVSGTLAAHRKPTFGTLYMRGWVQR
jgi:hypothetical protein